MALPTHLIIVCCHGIYLGPDSSDESNWLIEPFQTGETGTYMAHIEAGVRELARDDGALLVFSGGATKRPRTDKTEGESYLQVALERNLFGHETTPPTLRKRIFVDRFATDSYQNILCPLIQFPLFCAAQNQIQIESQAAPTTTTTTTTPPPIPYSPVKLTIVSHAFKRARFLDLHLRALRWARETNYVGIDPPFDAVKTAEIETGDRLRGYGAWEGDLYGVGDGLAGKRVKRGWDEGEFRRRVLEVLSEREREQVSGLMFWRPGVGVGSGALYTGKLPWD